MGKLKTDHEHYRHPATLTFREQLKRMRTSFGSEPNGTIGNGGQSTADERMPLIANGSGASHSNHGFWHDVFLDPKKTPGLDSPNPFVRWPVHVFNVFKIVLLSST